MKKIILIIALMFLLPLSASAYDSGYQIDSYNVNIKVNEDNTLDIEERIMANFKEDRHGIIRNIPRKNEVKRADGSTEINHARISDIRVNEEYETSYEGDDISIQIGDAYRTITGPKEYIIKYTYSLSKDKSDEFDELYFNIIGPEWNTYISNVTFNITMPKDFDETKVGFSSGAYGTIGTNNINYTVNNNVISGSYYGTLASNNALTIRVELDEGYFVYPPKSTLYYILTFLLPIIFIVIAFYFWFKYGKDEKPVETVEFYPPEGYNSLDTAYMYKGSVNNKDVVSLLIYLANKGYLKIEENDKKSLLGSKNNCTFIKLKEYDGNDECERIFLKDLFGLSKQVKLSSLENYFYVTISRIINITKKKNKTKIYEKNTNKLPLIIMIILVCIIDIVWPLLSCGFTSLGFIILFPVIGFMVMFGVLFSPNNNKEMKIMGVIWGLIFGGVPLMFLADELAYLDKPSIISIVFGLICIIILSIFIAIMPKRNKYGIEILGKIKGFKNFLETAEKPQLEAQVEKNPTYFYDILPYTYVLGVSDKWMKKFEGIALVEPDWYLSSRDFDIKTFSSSINDTMTSSQLIMASTPSSNGSSGGSGSGGGSFSSGGGGFSGGGSGGGGGSSW